MSKVVNVSQKKRILMFAGSVIAMLIIVLCLCFGFGKKDKNISSVTGEAIGFYNINEIVTEVNPVEESGKELPEDLVIKPGIYQIYGKSYSFEKQGLYRIILPEKDNQQRIVFNGDIKSLMSALAWIYSHGSFDNEKSYNDLKHQALTGKLVTTCGEVSKFAQNILKEKGVESRIVSGLTSKERNGYDDSHTMIEVKEGDVWKLYDLDNNATFTKDGRALNYMDFQTLVASGSYEIQKLSLDTKIAILGFEAEKNDYDYSLYAEERFYSDEALRNWYKRVLQVPFIKEGDKYYYFDGDEKDVQTVIKNSKKLNKDDFIRKFYD